ncbi:hypothetical protein [Pseudoalteromonas umbrosa]|uniref:hypothetical protein n=1 Tax=Pseudoalteromonas umbrosa TaxID=3048489 RepID=UPI0024C3FC61|nr:hypothetical protein [Pseudoalteromonas sp. B95]MDK1286379.1 hypothetical protein [Pseudoalteromonas sp. B95]
MNNKFYNEVDILWKGPFEVSCNRETLEHFLSEDVPPDIINSHGVYQIYGEHPIYGRDVLLYIGQTAPTENNARGFGLRLKEHFRGRFWSHCNLTVRFGRCYIDENEIYDKDKILVIESLLIACNMPALNREYLDGAKKSSEHYIVRNWDFKGSIAAECSSIYWTE